MADLRFIFDLEGGFLDVGMVATFRLLRLLELVLDDLRALRLLFGCSLFSACDHAVRHLLKVTAVTPIMHRTIGTQALAKASIVSQCLHGHVRASSLK